MFLSISSAFTYNSLWLSCSIRVRHIKDGDHTSCLCSISQGSESSILTGREEGLANSVLLYLLLCLPFSPCFCIRGARYRSTAAYCGRGGNINESTLVETGWNDKSIKVIIFPQWINPADLLITCCSVKTMLTENNGIKERLTLIKQLSWNVFFKPVIFPSDIFNHVIYANHRDTLLLQGSFSS